MTAEQRLHDWLRRQLGTECDYQRIEAHGSGFPDVNLCMNGIERWVELKVITVGRTLLRKEQWAWGWRRYRHGGKVFVISWHEKLDQIFVWKFPEIETIPYSKYLQITNSPAIYIKNSCEIKQILFDR